MRVVVLVLLLMLCAAQDCLEKGFVEGTLDCGVCSKMMKVIGDDVLYSECAQCCSNLVTAGDGAIYIAARLDIAQQMLPRFPHIEQFVNKYAADFQPAFTISYSRSFNPIMYVTHQDGKQEPLHVSAWKTEHFVEFLKEKLRPSA